MTCRCAERRAAIVAAIRKPSTALTAAQFVAKTGTRDIATVTVKGTKRIMDYLQRRG